jgi:bacterioferritin-associated ferredoxin
MLVCICKGVSEQAIDSAVESGARTVEAVGRICGAGTDCGSCHEAIEELIDGTQLTRHACARNSPTKRGVHGSI